ncbi:PqqD family protein [Motilibacter rhizosphaerae]|nr:PqqD family protein [Motilibacter rhizosphaerae]
MAEGTAYAVEPGKVVHETLDGETILIALTTGVYYSLTGTGPAAWSALSQGVPVERCTAALAARYPGADPAQVASDVAALTGQLLAEELLSPGGAAADGEVVLGDAPEAYAAPLLQRYDDMEYLLLLDPVHEADDNGWPQALTGSTG